MTAIRRKAYNPRGTEEAWPITPYPMTPKLKNDQLKRAVKFLPSMSFEGISSRYEKVLEKRKKKALKRQVDN